MPDRLELLRQQSDLTGIDFVYVHGDQTQIDVYWHVEPDVLAAPLVGTIAESQVSITSTHAPKLPHVAVDALAWPHVDGRLVMRLTVAEPGDFVIYRLAIDDARLDDHFNDVPFSFQAGCPSRLDCQPVEPPCPDVLPAGPPTDHTARDFWRVRRAMLDAATLLEPTWLDHSEADQLVMLTEAMASIADEFSYTQDRIRWEASFEHATQLRSLRRHAQLVDHRMHDGMGASTWVAVTTTPASIGNIPAGTVVWAETETGERVEYSVGHGLDDELDGVAFGVDHRRNVLSPHIADDDASCLSAGATSMAVAGHVGAAFPALGDAPLLVVLREVPADAGVPERAWVLPVIAGVDDDDPIVADPGTGAPPAPITVLRWERADAPPFDLDLEQTTVLGNVVPVTAGTTLRTEFIIGPAGGSGLDEAVERVGPHGSTELLHSLPDPEGRGLVWRPGDERNDPTAIGGGGDVRATRPELAVLERRDPDPAVRWEWRPHLVGPGASTPDDRHVTLDDGTWGPAATYQRPGAEIVHRDWLSGRGHTVRFGDGEFGTPPPDGTHFEAVYRLGNGRAGNVPVDAISHHDGTVALINSVTNPLAVTDGAEAESIADTRRVAPYEWQTITYRAVRTEDYAEALTRLDWVQAAGAVSRWTGSWLSIVATPDPLDAVALTAEWRDDARRQLDRFRQAGRDVIVGEPRYADFDIDAEVCVEASAYRGDVVARVLAALIGDPSAPDAPYFFDPDRFVFGTALHRAALDAAIQRVPGVRAVEGLTYRRRGHFGWQPMPAVVTVGPDELVRVANDRAHPERGTVRIATRGGA